MAFTDEQKDIARGHLNYPITSWSVDFISQAMDRVSALSSEAESRIGDILTNLTSIETAMDSYRANSGVQVVPDGTVYFQSSAITELQIQYNYWQSKLATALDIPAYNQQRFTTRRMMA